MPTIDLNDPASAMPAGGAGVPASTTPAEPNVYWGKAPSINSGGATFTNPADIAKHVVQAPITKTQTEALTDIYGWSDTELSAWGRRLYGDGMIKDPNDWDGMVQAWQYAVQQAAQLYTSGGKKVTPWAFMDVMEKNKNLSGTRAKPTTTTHTSTSSNVPAKSDAQAAITQLFSEQLGRKPTDGELDKYTSMMMAQYRAHPETSTTVTHTDAKGNSTDNTTSTGAYNPQGFLQNSVEGDPEWGAYQAATTYFNALQGAIGAPSNEGTPGSG